MEKKKIVVMTGRSPYQNYFVNSLDQFIANTENLELSGVFLAGNKPFLKKLKNVIKNKGLVNGVYSKIKSGIETRAIHKYTYPMDGEYKKRIYKSLFTDNWGDIKTDKVFYQGDRLLSEWHEKIKDIDPDVIVVHGGGIIPINIISLAKAHTFNLHWGISPLYRGSYCSSFCILNNEIENIGVTIHELSMELDGGDIYLQGKPDIERDDTVFSIEMKLTQLGTKLVLDLLNAINDGNSLESQKQNFAEGHMYLRKDYGVAKARELNKLIDKGVLNEFVSSNEKN
jgi:folate-dependent phosphoribosylglycinamide formyltransferase PurN